jgi:hypothetical protein
MTKIFNPTVFIITLFIIVLFACDGKTKKPNPALASIDLLRGELILCSGDQFGEVSFALSCSYEMRETFDLGVSLLHSFEYEEAEKAFVQVIDADPDCPMAYWGVTMSISHSLWYQSDKSYLEKGSKLLEIAHELPAGEREKDYLDAISAYYENWQTKDQKTRALLYEKKMEGIYKKYPEDTEAAVFYALALRASADRTDKTYAKQKKSGKILEELFEEQPNHPGIAHYIIHNYDYSELAHLALPTARRYASIAPASPHAQHMPSHIFTRLGLWDESIESNVNSAESARCYAEAREMDGHWANELHAMGYLVYAYLQQGDNVKANEQYEYMKTIHDVYPSSVAAIAYPFAAIPARISVENRLWEKAANIALHESEVDWDQYPWQKSLIHFARALGSAHTKDFESAEKEIEIIKELRQRILDKGSEGNAKQVLIQIKILQGWLSFYQGDSEKGIALIKEATEMEDVIGVNGITPAKITPAWEFLGDMYLAKGNTEAALKAYETNFIDNPNRFNGLYGAAIAAKKLNKNDKAKAYFSKLLELAKNSNSDRIELKEAKKFIEKKVS